MKSKLFRFVLVIFVAIPSLLLIVGIFRGRKEIDHKNELQDAQMMKVALAAIEKWHKIPTKDVQTIDITSFSDSLTVDTVGYIPNVERIQLLRKTVFSLIQCYNSITPDAFLNFWKPYDWTLNKQSSSYLSELVKDSSNNPTNLIIGAWKKIIQKNQIEEISITAMKCVISWTKDVGDLTSHKFRDDIIDTSQVSLPPEMAIILSRSVFDSRPLSSEIIAAEGRVLYARVLLFVKYSFRDEKGSKLTIPLELGFYWSSSLNLWVPHVKGSTSAVDKYGIIF